MSDKNHIISKRVLRKLRLEPLSPNDQLSKSKKCLSADSKKDFKAYNHVFKRMMRDKRVTNIAVTGEFGVGKSSIIHSADRKTFPRHKSFLYVSLVDFKNIYEYSADENKKEDNNKTEYSANNSHSSGEISSLTESINSLASTISGANKWSSKKRRKEGSESPHNTKDESKTTKTDAREDFLYCFLNQLRSKYSIVRMQRFVKGVVSLSLALVIILGLWLYSPEIGEISDSKNAEATPAVTDVANEQESSAVFGEVDQIPSSTPSIDIDQTKEEPTADSGQNVSGYSFKNYINGLFAALFNVPYYILQLFGRIMGKDGGTFACTKHEFNFGGVSPVFGILAVILLYFGVWQVLKLLRLEAKMKELSLKFFDVDAKLAFVSQDLPIEKSCPEIISLLKELAREIKYAVVFDDMDRLGKDVCYSLLTKLREVNHVLNTRTRKTIRFIYPLNNDIYEISRGTKFFDAVIPVISRVDETNAGDYLFDLIKERMGIELRNKENPNLCRDKDDLDTEVHGFGVLIGECISDYRSIHQILNELAVLTKRGPKIDGNNDLSHYKEGTKECLANLVVKCKEGLGKLISKVKDSLKKPVERFRERKKARSKKLKVSLLQNLSFVLYKNLLPNDVGDCVVLEATPSGRVELIKNLLKENMEPTYGEKNQDSKDGIIDNKSESLGGLISYMLKQGWLSGNEYYSLGKHGLKIYKTKAEELVNKGDYRGAINVLNEAIEKYRLEKYNKTKLAEFKYYICACNCYISIRDRKKANCEEHISCAAESIKEAFKSCPEKDSDLYFNMCRMLVSLPTKETEDDAIKEAIAVVKKLTKNSADEGKEIFVGLDASNEESINRELEPRFVKWKIIEGTDRYICDSAFSTVEDLWLFGVAKEEDTMFMGTLVYLTMEEFQKYSDKMDVCARSWKLMATNKTSGPWVESAQKNIVSDTRWNQASWRPVLLINNAYDQSGTTES